MDKKDAENLMYVKRMIKNVLECNQNTSTKYFVDSLVPKVKKGWIIRTVRSLRPTIRPRQPEVPNPKLEFNIENLDKF